MKWPTAKLGQIAPPERSVRDFAPEEPVWHLNLDQIESQTGRILTKQRGPASEGGASTFPFDEGHVLYSKLRPYLNKVVRPDEPGIATTELVPLRPRRGVLEPDFLKFYLRSDRFVGFANHVVAGAKMPRMIMEKFWIHEIPLPAPKEQRRIVELLEQADVLRRRRAEADEVANRIVPALFYKTFGDPATNPKGLRKERLGNNIKVKSGEPVAVKKLHDREGYPVYGGNGINGYHTEFMFDRPVVVIGRVGVYCGSVYYAEPRCWVTDNALFVSEISPALDAKYLGVALRFANLNQYAGRAGQPLVSGSRIYPIAILIPPKAEQERFVALVDQIEKCRANQRTAVAVLERLFAVLLHRAFTGELTAKWRKAHLKELLVELEQQARLLKLPVAV